MNPIFAIITIVLAILVSGVTGHLILKRKHEIDPNALGLIERELFRWRHERFFGVRDGVFDGEYLDRDSQKDLAVTFHQFGRQDMCKRIIEHLERSINAKDGEGDDIAADIYREVIRDVRRIM